MKGAIQERAARLSAEIGERAARLGNSVLRDLVFAEARRELTQHFEAENLSKDAARKTADEIIARARGATEDKLTRVRLGQLWEVYSIRTDRWVPGTVTDIDGDYVTLRAQGQQWQSCHVNDMRDGEYYRLISDLSVRR